MVHVDDVREGPEAMQASQQVAPFQSVGEGIEEEQGEATEDEGLDRRLTSATQSTDPARTRRGRRRERPTSTDSGREDEASVTSVAATAARRAGSRGN